MYLSLFLFIGRALNFFGVPDWSIIKVMKSMKQITHICDVVYPHTMWKQYIVNKQL